MKIAVITTSYPVDPGDPAGHFVAAEVRQLIRQGHDVTVIAPRPPGTTPNCPEQPRMAWVPAHDSFGWPGAIPRLRRSPRRTAGIVRFIAGARWQLGRLGPWDRIVAQWLVPSGWPIALGGHGPLEVVVHGSDARLLVASPRLVRDRVLKALLRRGARLRFVSYQLLDELAASTSLPIRAHASVEPSPIDVSGAPPRSTARHQLGIDPAERLIVIASRLVRDKRVHVALSASTLLPRTRVVVLGTGPEEAQLKARFEAVEFCGAAPRNVTLTWLSAADVVLSASLLEGAPSVVREARALDTTVVTTAAGDIEHWSELDPGLHVVTRRRLSDSR